ncbi:MAG: peptidylprolyl isomerase [Acidobacteria bacterium]|nr:MAG: peptidylprolyl isomerase [Acidobacteriota bacterium]PYQ79828.1 MAG: peptidylprolyl isomerase [Acidobacteriota bacterium]
MLMSTFRFVVLAGLIALSIGCSSSPTGPSNDAPFSQTDLRVGTGAVAAAGQTLTVNYTGWFYDASKPEQKGVSFDSTVGKSPFTFTLGAQQVIKGWDQGLPGMQVGGLRRLVIPPSLAYGSTRSGSIPANSTLLFEIELLDAQ